MNGAMRSHKAADQSQVVYIYRRSRFRRVLIARKLSALQVRCIRTQPTWSDK